MKFFLLLFLVSTSITAQPRADEPRTISIQTLRNCLRASPSNETGFTNACRFNVAFTYCFSMGRNQKVIISLDAVRSGPT